MEVQGVIKQINETQTFGNNGFRKREVIITTQEQYPQHILVEFVQDKTDLLNNYAEGQLVKVGVNLRGREWTNPEGVVKYFNTIQAWRIEGATGSQAAPKSAADAYLNKQKPEAAGDQFLNGDFNQDEEPDLPF